MWIGKGASKEEEQGAQYIANVLKCQTAKINEGQEPGSYEATWLLIAENTQNCMETECLD